MTQTIGCIYAKKKKRKNFDQYFTPYQKKKKLTQNGLLTYM